MKKRSGAGSLSESVVFMELNQTPDQWGGVSTGYVDRFTEAARLQPRQGNEPYVASRLAGIQPFSLTVRSSTRTRAITPAWRARNSRTGATYNIKSVVNIDERGAYLEMLVTDGEPG